MRTAPYVVYIHGFPFTSELWIKQLEGLPQNVNGIAYDIRGFGGSTTNHEFLSIDLFARDLLNLIKKLCHGPVILCGVSMGGYIALRAMEIGANDIHGLILSDTHAMADTNESKINRFNSIDLIQREGLGVFAGNFIKKLFSAATIGKKNGISSNIFTMIVRNSADIVCATQLALAARTDTSTRLNQIGIPVLLLRGKDDELTSSEQMEALQLALPEAELHVLDGAGHLPNYELPDAFNAITNLFISKHFSV